VLAAALSARVRVAGILGDDAPARDLRRLLDAAGVGQQAVVIDPSRPTPVKERFLAEGAGRRPHPLLRVDRECCLPLSRPQEEALLSRIVDEMAEQDAVLVADYGKGVCGRRLLAGLRAAAAALGRPVLVDPARGADYGLYRGAALLAPNRSEAAQATGRPITNGEDALKAGYRLLRRCGAEAILIKLDREGMALVEADGAGHLLPPWVCAAEDVAGAGDVVLATLGLCRASGVGWEAGARLACVAAGLEVGKPGVAPVWRAEVRRELTPADRTGTGKVIDVSDAAELAAEYRRKGLSVVLTNGCFDLLHAGHLRCLADASRLGDILVVAVNGDGSVRRLKGPGRPVVPARDRAALVAALACVDHVLIFDEDTPHALLRRLRPDVLAKGGTYTVDEVVGREVVHAYGGRVCVTGACEGLSTTGLLTALRGDLALASPDGDNGAA
jgi:D-beta-D-heptose 7-phosphate kinase/D-beta-D-heptose 1-phosphate adenosyltransferase